MKQVLTIAALLFALASALAAQTTTKSPEEQELLRIIHDLSSSALRGDRAIMQRYLAASYIETSDDGRVITKAQVLKTFADFQPPPESMKPAIDLDDIQVHRYGDTYVVSFRGTFQAETPSQKLSNSFRTTQVWLSRDGRWQLVAAHDSAIPRERVAVKVDPRVYDAYVGQYEIAPDDVVSVTREGDQLMEQETGQQLKIELLPASETTFFSKRLREQTIFVRDEKGQVTHVVFSWPDGLELKAKKIK